MTKERYYELMEKNKKCAAYKQRIFLFKLLISLQYQHRVLHKQFADCRT